MKVRDYLIAFIAFCLFVTSVVLILDDHWIWAIVLGIPSLFLLVAFFTELTNPSIKNKSNSSKDNYYSSGFGNLWLETRKGYSKFEMVGMYYRKLGRSDIGKFEGYVKSELNNIHDKYAVAIYNNNGKHIGYLPSGNKNIHDLILNNGGSLLAYGYISCDSNFNNLTGEVAIKTNIALNTDNPFYDQRITIIGKFDVSQKELAAQLRDMGAYISNSVHEHTDIVLIGENIKGTQMMEKLELLKNNGCNIKTIYREDLENILSKY